MADMGARTSPRSQDQPHRRTHAVGLKGRKRSKRGLTGRIHIHHIRRQEGIPKTNSHPKSQGFSPHSPETLQRRMLQIHNYRRIIINLQKNHGRQAIFSEKNSCAIIPIPDVTKNILRAPKKTKRATPFDGAFFDVLTFDVLTFVLPR
jgi:hypothetical protein